MSDLAASFLAMLGLAGLHLLAGTRREVRREWHPTMLSAAAGVSVAYVFLELMPDLAERQKVVESEGLLVELDHHVYITALAGLVVAFWVETASRRSRKRQVAGGGASQTSTPTFWLSMAAFAVFNLALGYAIASPQDEAVQPLWMFVIAMGLHFLASDHSLAEHHGERFSRIGRWLLIASLLVGWVIGVTPPLVIPEDALALMLAYIAGVTIMNVLHHELPDTDRETDVVAFVVAAAVYGSFVLLIAPN